MISNKTLAIIFLITLNMQLVASTFPKGTKRRKLSDKFTLTKRQRRQLGARVTVPVLRDTTCAVQDVEAIGESIEKLSISLEQPASQIKSQFGGLIEQGEYKKIFELGKKMNKEEFLKQLCSVIKTFDQYKRLAKCLKKHKMVASFYVFGDIEVVKEAIIARSKIYANNNYVENGNLEAALLMALKEGRHDRVIELLDIRKGITAEKDEPVKRRGRVTSFGYFVNYFLKNLVPWRDRMAFKRFLTLRGEELRSKNPDILDTLCRELVDHLSSRLRLSRAKRLLVDLIGQPSLLTPVPFTRGFLCCAPDETLSNFIKYAWSDAAEEVLKNQRELRGKYLWRVMTTKHSDRFHGDYPETNDALNVVLSKFPTKQKLEEEWAKKNGKILLNKLIGLGFIHELILDILWPAIAEYAVTLIDTEVPAISTK